MYSACLRAFLRALSLLCARARLRRTQAARVRKQTDPNQDGHETVRYPNKDRIENQIRRNNRNRRGLGSDENMEQNRVQ